jgi:hypothetical protein
MEMDNEVELTPEQIEAIREVIESFEKVWQAILAWWEEVRKKVMEFCHAIELLFITMRRRKLYINLARNWFIPNWLALKISNVCPVSMLPMLFEMDGRLELT